MLFNNMLNSAMAIGVRVEPELERRLDQLATSLGKSRSTCVREAIALYVDRFSGGGRGPASVAADPPASRLQPLE